jgi:predicted secreted hydrolase
LSAALGWHAARRDGRDLASALRTESDVLAVALSAWKRATGPAFGAEAWLDEPLRFPDDHGIHARTPGDRWQLAMKLTSGERRFLLLVAITRLGSGPEPPQRASRWAANHYFLSQVMLIDAKSQTCQSHRRYARAALGLAAYSERPPGISVDANSLVWRDADGPAAANFRLTLREPGLVGDIELTPAKRPSRLHGIAPKSGRAQGYIIARNSAQGRLILDGEGLQADGEAWLFHGWGDLPPLGGQVVIRSTTLMLDDGSELSLLRSERRDGTVTRLLGAFRIAADGTETTLNPDTVTMGKAEGSPTAVALAVRSNGTVATGHLVPWLRESRRSSCGSDADAAFDVEPGGTEQGLSGWGFAQGEGG